jgi:hypothetical protein
MDSEMSITADLALVSLVFSCCSHWGLFSAAQDGGTGGASRKVCLSHVRQTDNWQGLATSMLWPPRFLKEAFIAPLAYMYTHVHYLS